ncbi:MAG: metallophosphoesterase family protein, partial [Planctomycetota bacterium]
PEFQWAGHVLSHITVPAFTCIGNHDLDPGSWPPTINNWGTLPAPHNARRRYDTFPTPQGEIAVLSLPYFTPDEDIEWARGRMDADPKPTILLTHSWVTNPLGFPNQQSGGILWYQGGDLGSAWRNSPAQAYEKLVQPYPQIRLVLCGHAYGITRRTEVTALGTTVFSHLFNVQGDPYGGVEWLRLLAFRGSQLDLWTLPPMGQWSSINRTQVIIGLDLGQPLTDPVPLTDHYSGIADVEDTWIRSIWSGSLTNPTADLLYGAEMRPTSGGEIGLLRFRDPQIPSAVAASPGAILTLTKEGFESTGGLAFHAMLRSWTDQDSWNSLGGLAPGVDFEAVPDFELAEQRQWTWTVPVSRVPEWGWAIIGTTLRRGGIRSSEHLEGPLLTIMR